MSEENSQSSTADDYVMCPGCKGSKTMMACFVIYSPGHKGPRFREHNCSTCKGRGEISIEQHHRMELGKKYRDYRLNVIGYGLIQAAEKWGMNASDLSYIEQGKVVTDWTPPGWTEKRAEQ